MRRSLCSADGPALPERLPDGYGPGGLDHEFAVVDTSTPDLVEEPRTGEVIAHSMVFGGEHRRPVIVCTQYAAETRQACVFGEDPRRIEQQVGDLLVVITPASAEVESIDEWRPILLTTDLDRVTWMH